MTGPLTLALSLKGRGKKSASVGVGGIRDVGRFDECVLKQVKSSSLYPRLLTLGADIIDTFPT